ncbi:MAG: glycosyltransferase family A protein [Eubacteriales bacterium]|nr:glycosyltransferase family A protein [Eubacteriales bacterium]
MYETPLISIIVPVYNCEKYIAGCIESILNQTYRNIELILVDDGSLDSSASICQSYTDTSDIHIKLISKTNGGVSSARNAGISASTGKYLMFVDSDDTVDITICEELVSKAEASSSLLSLCGYNFVNFKAEHISSSQKIPQSSISSSQEILPDCKDITSFEEFEESYKSMFFNRIYLSTWAKLYLRSVIVEQELSFDEEHSLGEDLLFVHRYLEALFKKSPVARSSKSIIAVCNKALYNYNQYSAESLSRSYSFDRIDKNAVLFDKAMELITNIGLENTATKVLAVYYMRSINIVFLNNELSSEAAKSAFAKCCQLQETRLALSKLSPAKPEELLYLLAFKSRSMLWLRLLCRIRKLYLKLFR